MVAWRDQPSNPKPDLGVRLPNLSPHVPEWWRGEPNSPKLRRSATPPCKGLQAAATLNPVLHLACSWLQPKVRERRAGKKRNIRDLEPKLAYVERGSEQDLLS